MVLDLSGRYPKNGSTLKIHRCLSKSSEFITKKNACYPTHLATLLYQIRTTNNPF